MFAAAFAQHDAASLIAGFEAAGVTWGPFQTLQEAVQSDPHLSTANPILTETRHGTRDYRTPGAMATIPQATRLPPESAPALGQDSEQVLAEVLQMSSGEIGRLYDAGLVAGAAR